jgi:hypothetical protein
MGAVNSNLSGAASDPIRGEASATARPAGVAAVAGTVNELRWSACVSIKGRAAKEDESEQPDTRTVTADVCSASDTTTSAVKEMGRGEQNTTMTGRATVVMPMWRPKGKMRANGTAAESPGRVATRSMLAWPWFRTKKMDRAATPIGTCGS